MDGPAPRRSAACCLPEQDQAFTKLHIVHLCAKIGSHRSAGAPVELPDEDLSSFNSIILSYNLTQIPDKTACNPTFIGDVNNTNLCHHRVRLLCWKTRRNL
jgi:hypothetical protein